LLAEVMQAVVLLGVTCSEELKSTAVWKVKSTSSIQHSRYELATCFR